MKEFIEKLIGRLEEEIIYDTFDHYKEEPLINMSFERLEDIVNQLAEEYSVTGGWISCSSGQFPEEYCNVLLTVNHFEEAQKGFLDHGVWYAEDGIKYAPGSVIAWRSLPDLYVPEE